jgi:hypothetical protein
MPKNRYPFHVLDGRQIGRMPDAMDIDRVPILGELSRKPFKE